MKRSPKLDFPQITIRRNSKGLTKQLRRAVRNAIACSALTPGCRLPASRILAGMLGVSRNTVVAAYELLALEGLIIGRVGSGTRVSPQAPVLARFPSTARAAQQLQRLRESGFPAAPASFRDPDGNRVYIHG